MGESTHDLLERVQTYIDELNEIVSEVETKLDNSVLTAKDKKNLTQIVEELDRVSTGLFV